MLAAKVEAFRLSLKGKTKAETDEIAVRYFCAWNETEIHLKEHENASTEMAIQYQQMKTERDAALKEIDILRKQNQHLTGTEENGEILTETEKEYNERRARYKR